MKAGAGRPNCSTGNYMKQKPKSCACLMCRLVKTGGGGWLRRFEERAFRRTQKQALKRGEEVIEVAPRGDYHA